MKTRRMQEKWTESCDDESHFNKSQEKINAIKENMKIIEEREPRITRIQRIRNREKEGKTGERESRKLFAASPLAPVLRGEG